MRKLKKKNIYIYIYIEKLEIKNDKFNHLII